MKFSIVKNKQTNKQTNKQNKTIDKVQQNVKICIDGPRKVE